MKSSSQWLCLLITAGLISWSSTISAQQVQTETAVVDVNEVSQTVVGFGAALAYYEGWLPAHPFKAEIYDAIFAELSLDILRIRNAHNYDAGMIGRVKEFAIAAENSLGRPIDILSTSWGPPGYLKSNNDKSNGGTLRYTVDAGTVNFDYAGFADWWNESLDEYNANGIYPKYIGIQNEPDWSADYESCRLDPGETITAEDTIAGYNKSLDAVYNKISTRTKKPQILGPETIGIGYDAVERYVNKLDVTKLGGIAHHLYHGVSEIFPFTSTDFTKVGNFHRDIPHFQTEYNRGDWFALGGFIYKSFNDENVVAYLFWDLIWGEANGLVTLENPWTRSSWTYPKGYVKTKKFYMFKQFSAFIHPGWKQIGSTVSGDAGKGLTFISPDSDSATFVLINLSNTDDLEMHFEIPGYSIDKSTLYITSEEKDCEMSGSLVNSAFIAPAHSIVTLALEISEASQGIPVEQINLSPAKETLDNYAETVFIASEVLPANATNQTLTWEITGGAEMATITQLGYLTSLGITDGTVVVRATANDGSNVFGEVSISLVNQVLVGSINLSATKTLIDSRFDSTLITAAVLPENVSNGELTWEIVTGDDIARIEPTGWLYALGTGDGDVRVRVSANDASGKLKEIIIQVRNQVPVESIEISAPQNYIDVFQGSLQLTANLLPENASNKNVTWSIWEGGTMASVDQSGLLQATGTGNGIITVRAESEENSELSDLMEIILAYQVSGTSDSPVFAFSAWQTPDAIRFRCPASAYETQVALYSIDGRALLVKEIPPLATTGVISMEPFPGNIYLLEFRQGEDLSILKIAFMK